MTARRLQRDPHQPLRVVIVTRISDDRGNDRVVPHQTQRVGCERRVEALGGAVVATLHDDNIGGDRLDRPGLNEAIRLIKGGSANALMTYATDRLARDQVGLAVIVDRVRRAGGVVLSATEDLDNGPLGDFMRSAYGFAAQVELAKNRERINRSLDARFPQQR